jgi:ribonuclease PH
MAEVQESDDYGLIDVPVAPQPASKKSVDQFRPFGKNLKAFNEIWVLVMRSNFLDKVAGSGYVEFGKTCVLCSV